MIKKRKKKNPDNKILKICTLVREKILKYNPKSNLVDETLSGACGFCSVVLNRCLNKIGYRSYIVLGDYNLAGHCWVQYEQYVLDITGSQFGLSDVVIDKIQKLPKYYPQILNATEDQTINYGYLNYSKHEILISKIIKEVQQNL